MIPTIVLGLMLALLMQKAFKGSGIIKFILFSPWITPTVAVSIVWTWIYDPNTGIANTVMRFLHLPELQWIKSSDTAMLAVIIVTVWKSLGYAMIFIFPHWKRFRKSCTRQAAGWSKKLAEIPGISASLKNGAGYLLQRS